MRGDGGSLRQLTPSPVGVQRHNAFPLTATCSLGRILRMHLPFHLAPALAMPVSAKPGVKLICISATGLEVLVVLSIAKLDRKEYPGNVSINS